LWSNNRIADGNVRRCFEQCAGWDLYSGGGACIGRDSHSSGRANSGTDCRIAGGAPATDFFRAGSTVTEPMLQ
jgi:hypothetical protein